MRSALPAARRTRGITLLELLTAMAILAAVLALVFSVLSHSIGVWRQANSKIDAFQNARVAFESMTRRLGQATLNTYWDYYDKDFLPLRLSTNNTNFLPKYYGRYSDLHFLSGSASALIPTLPPGYSALSTQAVFFTVPMGLTTNTNYRPLPDLLNACGYFVAFGGDDVTRPSVVSGRINYRWRLLELTAAAETLGVFDNAIKDPSRRSWFAAPIAAGQVRPLADNIIALIIWPRLATLNDPEGTSIASDYAYDSRTNAQWSGNLQPPQAHQLPPTLQVTMVAIDEASAIRLQDGSTPPPAIANALANCFNGSVLQYTDDLQKKLEPALTSLNINFRVFTTTIILRESRWSR